MSSRIEQSFAALATLLGTIPGVTVDRNRDIPADLVSGTSAFIVTDGNDEEGSPQFIAADLVEFRVQAIITGYVTRPTYGELAAALDALWAAAFVKCAQTPRLTNGSTELTWNVLPGPTERELQSEQKKPTMAFRMPVTLCIQTQLGSLAA